RNSLIPADEARQLLEKVAQLARDKADWDLARKAADVYSKVATPGRDQELAARAFDAQARALAEAAKSATNDQAPVLETQARDLARQGAEAYERAAGKTTNREELAAWLWQGAQLFLRAGLAPRAQELLVRLTQQDGALDADKSAEAWHLIGNAYH